MYTRVIPAWLRHWLRLIGGVKALVSIVRRTGGGRTGALLIVSKDGGSRLGSSRLSSCASVTHQVTLLSPQC